MKTFGLHNFAENHSTSMSLRAMITSNSLHSFAGIAGGATGCAVAAGCGKTVDQSIGGRMGMDGSWSHGDGADMVVVVQEERGGVV